MGIYSNHLLSDPSPLRLINNTKVQPVWSRSNQVYHWDMMPKAGLYQSKRLSVLGFIKNSLLMSTRFSDALFQLVKSLEKAEKRHFKIYIKRSSDKEDLKVVQLFDALDNMDEYDEKVLFRKISSLNKSKLANLKTHLYKELLASLRLLKSKDSIDLQLSEHLDDARLLYNKGSEIPKPEDYG